MICTLCPRNCHAVRTAERGGGVCGMPSDPVIGKSMLHQWEEPCLTGKNGAGAVFFTGCSLRCVFCQNAPLSHAGRDTASRRGKISGRDTTPTPESGKPYEYGKICTPSELRGIFRQLVDSGAACLDLVTPSHFTPAVVEALGPDPWPAPVVWNSSGYEKPETLRMLDGRVQIYLPDFKYALSGPAEKYSGAADYFEQASAAVVEMYRQRGPYRMENSQLRSGVLIRHLILPGEMENTRRVIDWISRTFEPGTVLFSLMRQYTPQAGASGKLARKVSGAEYHAAVEYMRNCGISDGYTQDAQSAVADYTPEFSVPE